MTHKSFLGHQVLECNCAHPFWLLHADIIILCNSRTSLRSLDSRGTDAPLALKLMNDRLSLLKIAPKLCPCLGTALLGLFIYTSY